jgi:hypothetical protein
VTRFVPRKSLLVLGLLATVVGYPAAAFAAVAPTLHSSGNVQVAAAHTAVITRAPVREQPAETTSYLASFLATTGLTPATTTAHLSTPGTPVTDPTGVAEPATTTSSGGVCSVPGIGSIGSLLGLCQSGTSGLGGLLNNICQPSLPQPEEANGGIDSIVRPPATPGPQDQTLYDNYGVAGLDWNATNLQCSDMTSLIGNNVAGMVFDAAKAVDRVTITVYQSAAGNGILSWLANVVNRLITSLGNAIYFPYLVPVVLLGVMWLAWHGLIRKRATRTIEGTVWMIIACVAAIWLISQPGDFTGLGQGVSNGVTQVLNVAFSKLPAPGGGGSCVPVQAGDPQSPGGSYSFTQGNGLVGENANELWSVLACKPWLDGEFGTTQFSTTKNGQTAVNKYGRQLLWAQAIAANETPSTNLIKAKQATYQGIANSIQTNDPGVYPLFQGNQWTSRLEIGFAALFAALIAGVLVLLIAVTLIILKLGFLLLLIAGPFFLIVGTHPGFGRVVAMRWVEMIIGVLLKQVAVAIVLSVLLYAYSLIMGTSDAALPWALKILMIALVTIAVFIYRKPFQHLFSAVGYGAIGSQERSDIEIYRSRESLRRTALDTAAVAYGGSRVARWARRSAPSATLAEHIALANGGTADVAGQQAGGSGSIPYGQNSVTGNGAADAAEGYDGTGNGTRAGAGGNGRAWAAAGVEAGPRTAPPLHLSSRAAQQGDDGASAPSGWARSGTAGTGQSLARTGEAPPRPAAPPRMARSGSAQARTAPPPAAGAGGVVPRAAGPAPRLSGPPPRVSGGATRSSGGGSRSSGAAAPRATGPVPRPSGPAPRGSGPVPRGSGPVARTSGGGPAPAANGGGRWRSDTAAGQAPAARGGRPLWQPGPIRPSGGWSGGSRQAPPPPPPPVQGSSASAAPSSGYPSNGGGWSGARRTRNGAQSGRSQAAPRHTGGNGSAGNQGSGPAGTGSGGRDPAAAPPQPTPFWLRPVRRKK